MNALSRQCVFNKQSARLMKNMLVPQPIRTLWALLSLPPRPIRGHHKTKLDTKITCLLLCLISYKSVLFFCMNLFYRVFKKCKISLNKLKCNKKLFVSCQRLLIWETLTCSWRNVTTADVLPRFSRQPMERRRGNFSFHPSFVPQLEQSSWEAVIWKDFFFLWVPAFTTFSPSVQNYVSFLPSQLFSGFLS